MIDCKNFENCVFFTLFVIDTATLAWILDIAIRDTGVSVSSLDTMDNVKQIAQHRIYKSNSVKEI